MTTGERVGLWTVVFDVAHGGGFNAPEVVDEEFGVNAEEFIKEVFVLQGDAGESAEGGEVVFCELFGSLMADAPKVGEGSMVPKFPFELSLVEESEANAVLVWLGVLGENVHRDFGEVKIGAGADGGGEAGFIKYVLDDATSESFG